MNLIELMKIMNYYGKCELYFDKLSDAYAKYYSPTEH
jgi:hypothetical protein